MGRIFERDRIKIHREVTAVTVQLSFAECRDLFTVLGKGGPCLGDLFDDIADVLEAELDYGFNLKRYLVDASTHRPTPTFTIVNEEDVDFDREV